MDKQKQIEEIEKEYKEWAVGLLKVRFDLKPEAFDEHHKNNYSFENCADCLWNKIKGSIEELLWLRENQLPENAVVLTGEKELEQYKWSKMLDKMGFYKFTDKLRKETAEKFAERVKMAFYYEFEELIPSIMADKIDEICKEITERGV